MNFSLPIAEFQKAIARVLPAVPPKSTIPLLEHFLLEFADGSVKLTGTDQELVIACSVPAFGTDSFSLLVPARKLSDIVKALGGEGSVEFSVSASHEVSLRTSFGTYGMKCLPAEDYPALPGFDDEPTFTMNSTDLVRIANKTIFAVSDDEYRPAMTGVYMQFLGDELRAAATDSYRLSRVIVRKSGMPSGTEIVVPKRVMENLKKVETDAQITITPTHIRFVMGAVSISSPLIDEKFPPYDRVIPKDNDKTAILSQRELLQAIKRVSIFTSQNSKQVRLSFSESTLSIRGEDDDAGSNAVEVVKCDFIGAETLEVGFNYRYLEEAVQNVAGESESGDRIRMSFSAPTRAALLMPDTESDELLILVMPVRL